MARSFAAAATVATLLAGAAAIAPSAWAGHSVVKPKELRRAIADNASSSATPKSLKHADVVPIPFRTDKPRQGWHPKLHVLVNGEKYTFKADEPGFHYVGDLSWYNLRTLLNRPALAPIRHSLEWPGMPGKMVEGYLKPKVQGHGRLSGDPKEWSAAQRQVVLRDLVWSTWVGDQDTKAGPYGQYEVVRSKKLAEDAAYNGDHDETFNDYRYYPASHTTLPITRFDHQAMPWRRLPEPTAASLLFQAHVHGRVDLGKDLEVLGKEAAAIQSLSRSQIKEAMKPFLRDAFAGGKTYGIYRNENALLDAIEARRDFLAKGFQGLTRQLESERAEREQRGEKAFARLHPTLALKDKRITRWQKYVESDAKLEKNAVMQEANARKLGLTVPTAADFPAKEAK